jgi:GTP cyclohydrolase I
MSSVLESQAERRQPPRLTVLDGAPRTNVKRAEAAVAELLTALGRDVTSEHLAQTPRRVVASLMEMLTPHEFAMTTFPNDEGYTELVLVRDIPFQSLCEHHLLPFHGVAHVGYVPGERLVGLSKLARSVELFARDLQVQERLTRQIADYLQEQLSPRGVGVVLEAEHLCMSMRGVRAAGARTTTSAFLGVLAEPGALREEFGTNQGSAQSFR